MKRAAWYSQSVRRNTPCASAKAARSRMDSSTPSERAYVSTCKVDRHTLPMVVRRVANEMHSHTVFAERVRTSEESHPPSLTAEVRLVSEASVGNGKHLHLFLEKRPLLKNRPSSGDSLASCNSLLANRKSSSVAVSRRMKAEACIALPAHARDPTTDLSCAISWSRARSSCLRPSGS